MAGPQMQGFTEKGEPDEWDAAIGTVRGFRWWTAILEFQERDRALRSRYSRAYEWEHSWAHPWHYAMHFPVPDKSDLIGMNSKSWKRAPFNGFYPGDDHPYEATCLAGGTYTRPDSEHRVPDPSCGCGFWAYWKPDMYSYANVPYVRQGRLGAYTVAVPVAGCIEGSGRTIIGEKGFRTQRARITNLALHVRDGMFLEYDRREYAYERFFAAAATWPGPAPVYTPQVESPGPQFSSQNVLSFLSELCQVPQSDVRDVLQNAVTRAVGDEVTWHGGFEKLKLLPRDKNYGGDSEVLEA